MPMGFRTLIPRLILLEPDCHSKNRTVGEGSWKKEEKRENEKLKGGK